MTEPVELWGGPFDGITVDPETLEVGTTERVLTDAEFAAMARGVPPRPRFKSEDYTASVDTVAGSVTITGPAGTAVYHRMPWFGKTRWKYRKGSMK